MGLDLVELVMEIEDEFGVSIPDEAAASMLTVGDLFEFLIKQKDRPLIVLGTTCLSSAAFYRIRRSLMKVFGVSRRLVRLDSRLDHFIPAQGRKRRWDEFAQALMFSLPGLHRPLWLSLFGVVILVAVCGFLVVWFAVMAPMDTLLSVAIVAAILTSVFQIATYRLCRVIPSSCATVGALASYAAIEHRRLLTTSIAFGGRSEVWDKLRSIIVHQLGVRPEDVKPETRWVQDLGAG